MSYFNKMKVILKIAKTATWKLVPGPFLSANNLVQPLLENETFEANYLH